MIGLVINTLLGVVKLAAGLIGHSFALIADAVNSLGDVFTSAVVLFALRMSQKPPDVEHPYGHTRAEAIAGSNVALLVLISALLVGWEAVRRWTSLHTITHRPAITGAWAIKSSSVCRSPNMTSR